LEARAQHIKRKKIEEQMCSAGVQKKCGEETPVLVEHNNTIGLEGAETMQYLGISLIAGKNFQQKHGGIEQNKNHGHGRFPQAVMSIQARGAGVNCKRGIKSDALTRFERSE